jgi:hypothetical protein
MFQPDWSMVFITQTDTDTPPSTHQIAAVEVDGEDFRRLSVFNVGVGAAPSDNVPVCDQEPSSISGSLDDKASRLAHIVAHVVEER